MTEEQKVEPQAVPPAVPKKPGIPAGAPLLVLAGFAVGILFLVGYAGTALLVFSVSTLWALAWLLYKR